MKTVLLCVVTAFLLSIAVYLYAAEAINILGTEVPIVSGAVLKASQSPANLNAQMATYIVNKPLDEVVDFYKAFFAANNFLILGGAKEDGSFDAAAKKDKTQFSLRIFAENNSTIIQFIW